MPSSIKTKPRPDLPRLEVCSCEEAENYRAVLQKIVDFCTGDAHPLTESEHEACSCGANDWRQHSERHFSCGACGGDKYYPEGHASPEFNSFGACIQIVNLATEVLKKHAPRSQEQETIETVVDLREPEDMKKMLVFIEEELS